MNDLKNNELIIINEENIKGLIYEIRGQKVMLDFDLARIYGYETRTFNQQIKNNIDKFPEDFMFQISKDESEEIMISKKLMSFKTVNTSGTKGGRTHLPYAFTEQGIYMLMTVLKGEIATKQSLALIRLFKLMKDYIVETNNLVTVNEVLKLSRQVNENTLSISKLRKDKELIENKLDVVMDNFIDPTSYKQFVIFDGQKTEGTIAYQTIYSLAKCSIIIVNDYISIKTLDNFKVCESDIQITICSDNVARDKLTEKEYEDFVSETDLDIKILPTNNIVHDRVIVIDYNTDNKLIYLCSPSSKDAGNRIGTIVLLENPQIHHQVIDKLLN